MYLTLRKSNTLICFENQWYVQWRLGFRNIYAIFIVTFSRAKFFVLPVCVKTDMLSKDINLLFMQIGWNVFHKKQRKSVLYDCIKSLKNFTFFIMNVPSWDHLKMTDRYFTPLEICVWYDDMKNKRIGGWNKWGKE